jgi:hypothetical protein
LRVVDQTVGDRRGHSSGIKYFFPIGKRQIRGNDGGFVLMPLADDLEE